MHLLKVNETIISVLDNVKKDALFTSVMFILALDYNALYSYSSKLEKTSKFICKIFTAPF